MPDKFETGRTESEKAKIKEELQKKYKESWKTVSRIFPPQNNANNYMGDLDADVEWSNDHRAAYMKFTNIEAYRKFTEEDNLILMGRTGTGKSYILNRYSYAVKSGEIKDFDLAFIIKFESLFNVLKQYEFADHLYTPGIFIEQIIDLCIKLCTIQKLVNNFSHGANRISENTEMQILSNYLQKMQITQETNIVDNISWDMTLNYAPGSDLREVICNFISAYNGIKSIEVDTAYMTALNRKKVLVLSDTMDYYDITEKKIIVLCKTLIDRAFEYQSKYKKRNILLKVAVPSEIYTYVIQQIVAKRKSKTVTIEWRYKDIIKMLALKIFYYFENKEKESPQEYCAQELITNYTIEDFYNYDVAESFLHKMLPKVCRACIPMEFETLPYCIRHTQKKPRQIVTIFNLMMDKICEEEQYDFFIHHSNEISRYVHMAQTDIIEDALNMYNQSSKQLASKIAWEVLNSKRNVMSIHEFNAAVRSALKLAGFIGLSDEDIKRMLIESGLVGLMYEEHYVKENSKLFNNDNVIKVCVALFEYQIKDTLAESKGGKYVLHPMCYEYFMNEIDYNMFIYPAPANDAGDNILSRLDNEEAIF